MDGTPSKPGPPRPQKTKGKLLQARRRMDPGQIHQVAKNFEHR